VAQKISIGTLSSLFGSIFCNNAASQVVTQTHACDRTTGYVALWLPGVKYEGSV